jgi:hypothetical protein
MLIETLQIKNVVVHAIRAQRDTLPSTVDPVGKWLGLKAEYQNLRYLINYQNEGNGKGMYYICYKLSSEM